MNRNQNSTSASEQREFLEHLQQASKIVKSWPVWKQTVLGAVQSTKSADKQGPNGSETEVD